jgi:outer membrane cobalamin receptor
MNYGNMGGGIFGNDGLWLLLVLLLGGGRGGFGGFGFGGGYAAMMGMGMMDGFGLYPWMNQVNQMNDGFRDQMMNGNINSIRDGVQGLSTQLCQCCGDMRYDLANSTNGIQNSIFGAQVAIGQQLNANEMASLNRSFAEQSANQQGFNGVQSGIADLRYTTAKESCDTRTQAAMNTRDIIDAIKGGDQMIYDKLCALELDGVKTQLAQAQRENVGLQNQVNMATARAENLANADNIVNSLYSRLSSCPTPSIPVAGNTPLFSCNPSFNSPNTGCGCNGGF